MTSDELFDAFRSDVVDIVKPYFWSDAEIYRYMNDAYFQFVRLTGGIADNTSTLTQLDVVTGEADAPTSPLILKYRAANLVSNWNEIKIVNYTDLPMAGDSDYGRLRQMYLNKIPGPVRYMLVGQNRATVTWLQVPMEEDTVALSVYRLPLSKITGPDQEFTDVGEEHHENLLLWMKARAYDKHDADTFDKGRSDAYRASFIDYCKASKAEWERAKSKVRVVTYGGL